MRTKLGLGWTIVLAAGLGLPAAACGSDDSSGGAGGAGAQDGGAGTGGTAGTGTGGTAGTGTGGTAGTGTGGTAGTGTGGTAGTGTGGTAGTAGTGGSGGQSLFNCDPPTGSAPALKLTQVENGFDRPLTAKSPDGDTERLFVAEQHAGVIHIVKNGSTLTTPFMDISDRVISSGNERGLLAIAFHPGFMQNGRFFVHYTANGTTASSGSTVVSEFAATGDTADPSTEKVLLTQAQPESNHNGGTIEFGPDGMLYIGLGDGGGAGDQHGNPGNGQSTDTLLGKILRIDVDGAKASGKEYGIPAGNMTGSGVAPELWAYGLRNPWRSTFDACTGDFYIGDVGQNAWEEIDVQPKSASSGINYGWRVMEGTHCYNPASGCDQSGKQLPVAEYSHSQGCSVTGGYVYRGSAIPGLRGTYIYADYCSGRFWSFAWSGGAVTAKDITSEINPGTSVKQITSFGQDANGELYVVSQGGTIYRIEAQ